MRASGSFRTLGVLALTLVGTGTLSCSTARPSGHYGLFSHRERGLANESDDGHEVAAPPRAALIAARKLQLHWPLRRVEVTSGFGPRKRDFHEGIDLRAKLGTPVYAAQAGKVIYAGSRIRGYGKMIVIKHAYGIATVYGHNSRLLVKVGQHVRLGERIAISGNTGRSTGPHLHFEVRHGVAPMDPAQMISQSRLALVDEERKVGHSRSRSKGARRAHDGTSVATTSN